MSWNNFCYQASLISCPLVLAAIYSVNYNYTFYFSAIFPLIGTLIMGYLCTRKNAKSLGRVCNEEKVEEKKEVSVEMKPVEVKETEKEVSVEMKPVEVKEVEKEESIPVDENSTNANV